MIHHAGLFLFVTAIFNIGKPKNLHYSFYSIHPVKILACQISIPATPSDREKKNHVERVVSAIQAQCKIERPDLVVLPELSTIEYSEEAFHRLNLLAENLSGFSYGLFSELARTCQCHIAYGFPQTDHGRHYITHSVIAPSGELLTHYQKIHIAQIGDSLEKPFFYPGNRLASFQINEWRISIIICYDFRFTGLMTRIYERHQPDLILHPAAFCNDSTYASWHHFAVTRAIESQAYFLSLNRAGSQWGRSIFCPPWLDDNITPFIFNEKETFQRLILNRKVLISVRRKYPLRHDQLRNYTVFE